MHTIAKEQVALTQESLAHQNSRTVEPVCLEVLNHHIGRVNEAEKERLLSKEDHQKIQSQYEYILQQVATLERDCKKSIAKSRPYFEARVDFTKVLENQKALINRLELEIKQKKRDYAQSFKRLEEISNEIHEIRGLGKRDPGVGSETPEPAVSDMEAERRKVAKSKEKWTEKEMEPVLLGPTSPIGPRDRAFTAPLASERERRDSAGLSSGVILLAHHLDDCGFLSEIRAKAYSLPAEDYDCHYRTLPAGVKPFPTPPITPTEDNPTLGFPHVRRGSSKSNTSTSSSRRGSAVQSTSHSAIARRSSTPSQLGEPSSPHRMSPHKTPPPCTSPPMSPLAVTPTQGTPSPRGMSSLTAESGSDSDLSVRSGAIPTDDERIAAYMASHSVLMEEIDHESEDSETDLHHSLSAAAMAIEKKISSGAGPVEKKAPVSPRLDSLDLGGQSRSRMDSERLQVGPEGLKVDLADRSSGSGEEALL